MGNHCYTECHHFYVVRFYQNPTIHSRVLETGLTLAEAQAHCSDPESSSSTATGAKARRITRRVGEWFDGYDSKCWCPMREWRNDSGV